MSEACVAAVPALKPNNFLAELQSRITSALAASEAHVCVLGAGGGGRDAYGSEIYWEERYRRHEGVFEWLVTWEDLRASLLTFVQTRTRVLHVGCGNSTLAVSLVGEGVAGGGVTNVDISPCVIEQMRDRFAHMQPALAWEVCDVTAMQFADGSYDVVLDKGTLDALLCKDTPEAKACAALRLVAEAQRVLRQGGVYIVVSFGQPETRMRYLQGGAVWSEVRFQKITVKGRPHYWQYTAFKAAAGEVGGQAVAPAGAVAQDTEQA